MTKKITCPECGEKIDHLILYETHQQRKKFYVTDKGLPDIWVFDKQVYLDDEDEYECPACREMLFQVEEDAVRFLKGEE